jgi:hypothetical protein
MGVHAVGFCDQVRNSSVLSPAGTVHVQRISENLSKIPDSPVDPPQFRDSAMLRTLLKDGSIPVAAPRS